MAAMSKGNDLNREKLKKSIEGALIPSSMILVYSMLLIGILVLSRIMPHIPNVTATAAVSLLAIRIFKYRFLRYLVPLLGMIFSDLLLSGMHSTSIFVYAAIVLIIYANENSLKNWDSFTEGKIKLQKFASLIVPWLSASLIFFVVSNLAVWSMDQMYPKTVAGLFQCFAMAIPFYWTQMGGDFLYIFSLFGIFEFIRALNQSRSDAAPQE